MRDHSSTLATQGATLDPPRKPCASDQQSSIHSPASKTESTPSNLESSADSLSSLLETARSHGTQTPEASAGGFFDSASATLPPTDFSGLATMLPGLNLRLKTLLDELRQSSGTAEKILVDHSRTFRDLLSLDGNTLRDAHEAITKSRGLIFMDEKGKQLLRLINEGDICFDRANALSARLNELVSQSSKVF